MDQEQCTSVTDTPHEVEQSDLSQTEALRGSLGLNVHLTTPGSAYVFEGVMDHFIAGEASILLDCSFLKDTKVRVEFQGYHFDGEVLFCEAKDERYDTHIVIPDVDQTGMRRDPRYVVNLPGRLFPPHGGNAVHATVVDISREGLGVESPLMVDVGETVAVESQGNLAFGVVRHCRSVAGGRYRFGVQVYDVLSKESGPAPNPTPEMQRDRKKPNWMRSLFS